MTDLHAAAATGRRIRPVRLGPLDVAVERRPDGSIYLDPVHALPAYPDRLTERLLYWAERAPDRTFMAQRDARGEWRRLSYAQALDGARRIGGALLERGLSAGEAADDPVRQRYRARAARARRAACRHRLCAGVAGLFAGLHGLRQAAASGRADHARPGLRVRRRPLRPRYRGASWWMSRSWPASRSRGAPPRRSRRCSRPAPAPP